jgi:hypothetical protein
MGTGLEVIEEHGDTASASEEPPRYGSLAWLGLQEHVTVCGRELPSVHRVTAGMSMRSDQERGSRCAVVKADGVPCGAPATRLYGVCLVHAGGGADPRQIGAIGGAGNARLRLRRQLLGIGPSRVANPRALARLAAQERAEDIAAALLAPLDDRKLSSLEAQGAARTILGETFPLSTATIELDLPSDAEQVGSMGWADMQALAARLLEP